MLFQQKQAPRAWFLPCCVYQKYDFLSATRASFRVPFESLLFCRVESGWLPSCSGRLHVVWMANRVDAWLGLCCMGWVDRAVPAVRKRETDRVEENDEERESHAARSLSMSFTRSTIFRWGARVLDFWDERKLPLRDAYVNLWMWLCSLSAMYGRVGHRAGRIRPRKKQHQQGTRNVINHIRAVVCLESWVMVLSENMNVVIRVGCIHPLPGFHLRALCGNVAASFIRAIAILSFDWEFEWILIVIHQNAECDSV